MYHIARTKDKNHMVVSTDAEKALEKIQYHFMIKTLNKLVIKENYLIRIKDIYENSMANIIVNGEKLKSFHLTSRTR